MTNRNANVFYEVGYAHGLGKGVILLTQKADDIPFDLKHFPHIIYDGQIKFLSEQLKTRLEWFLNTETVNELTHFDFGLQFLINGQKIEEGKEINVTKDLKEYIWAQNFSLKIDIYNSSSKAHKAKFKIGLETSIDFKDDIQGLELIKSSADKALFLSKELNNVYPNAYKSVEFKVNEHSSDDGAPIKMEMKLKIFTNLELREINYVLVIPTRNDLF